MLEVLTKNFPAKQVDLKEVYRYAGIKDQSKIDKTLKDEIESVIKECSENLKYSVCYVKTPVKINGDSVDFDFCSVKSKSLSSHLKRSEYAVIFASTIGLEIDRLIFKYGKISPLKSLILQALGTERIESLCDDFCEFIKNEFKTQNLETTSRFSAGYGDFPLSFQKEIFSVLKPENKISLYLNESLIMSPSKSVTAVIGIGNKEENEEVKCTLCENKDCVFRR